MGRPAKLGRKNGYWYSEAGGVPRYYGRIGEVTYKDALRLFRERLTTPEPEPKTEPIISNNELINKFIEWLAKNREIRNVSERTRHLKRWCRLVGQLDATSIAAEHIEDFRADLEARGFTPDYVKKHLTTVRFLFNRSVKMGWLPSDTKPFAAIEPVVLAPRSLCETDLLTHDEVDRLFRWADADLSAVGQWHAGARPRRPDEYRIGAANPWRGFGDMLRVYHATGARTGELCAVRVADFQPRSRQLVLGKHKRSKTMKVPVARQIALNDNAFEIVERLCKGRGPEDPIFTRPIIRTGMRPDRPWDRTTIAKRFTAIRKLAGVRDSITIYSFRHLWISEMLMEGIDSMLIARMAGTSLAMIEKVYGHFRSQSL